MAASNDTFDLIVIGGGPAGYVGAIRAAQLGLKTACVERDKLGGVCLNWGCIPTKALLAGAEFYHRLKHEAADWGVLADNVRHDWSKVIARSRGVAGQLNKGVHALFKKNKITHIEGTAQITQAKAGDCRVRVGDRTLTAKQVLLATGARPRQLPFAPFDGDRIIASKEAMSLPEQPRQLIVIGAGAIGMEFAYFYNAYGTKVTVIEMMDRVLPIEDEEVSKALAKSFRKSGIECLTGHKTTAIEKSATGVKVHIENASGEKQTLEGDRVLVAIGVQGNVEGLFAEGLNIALEKGHIKTDYKQPHATYATSLPGIYAVGDVIGPPWLAHVASEEAIVCVERLTGHEAMDIDYDAIPGCTYCLPQVASLGATEQALQARGLKKGTDYRVGLFPFSASGKAQALGATEGFIKMITSVPHGEILGVHMVGESVTELLAEMGLAKRLEATGDEVIATMHAHPTLSEAIHEAALGTDGRMIHF